QQPLLLQMADGTFPCCTALSIAQRRLFRSRRRKVPNTTSIGCQLLEPDVLSPRYSRAFCLALRLADYCAFSDAPSTACDLQSLQYRPCSASGMLRAIREWMPFWVWHSHETDGCLPFLARSSGGWG